MYLCAITMNTGMLGYIFDYGGTLDTGGCHWGKVLWHAYEQCEPHIKEEEFRQAYVYAERTLGKNPIIKPDFTFYQTLKSKLQLQYRHLAGLGLTVEGGDKLLDMVYTQTKQHTRHSVEVLKELKATKTPMVLVSNFYGNIGVVLHEFGFDGLFDHIIESAVVGVRKPDPKIFQMGVQALGLEPGEVVVVGDSMDKDIVPAHSIGCQTVWFRGEPWADEPQDTTAADRIITDVAELLTSE